MSLDQTKEDRRQRARAERRRGGSEVRGERIEVRKPRSPSRPLSLSRFLDVLFALQTSYLSPPLASGPLYQGWVHAPGRRTGLQLLVLLSEGTVDGERRTSLSLFHLLVFCLSRNGEILKSEECFLFNRFSFYFIVSQCL